MLHQPVGRVCVALKNNKNKKLKHLGPIKKINTVGKYLSPFICY